MEAKITIKEIRSALNCDVALGHITKETAEHISKLLGLDWKEEKYKKHKDMECFIEDLQALFKRYDAALYFQGQYKGDIIIDQYKHRFSFGEVSFFDADFISLLPKMWKRSQMVSKLKFPPTTNIEEIRPILDAVRKVDRKSHLYVTDKQFNELITPYKDK